MMFPLVRELALTEFRWGDMPGAGLQQQAFFQWCANPVSQRDGDNAHFTNAADDHCRDDSSCISACPTRSKLRPSRTEIPSTAPNTPYRVGEKGSFVPVKNQGGRPRATDITAALRESAEHIVTEKGYTALTVEAIASRAGTTRPAFYRRYSSLPHLVVEIMAEKYGTGARVDTGALESDLHLLQRADYEMFSSPFMKHALLGILEAARAYPDIRKHLSDEFVKPRRENVTRVLNAAVDRGEIAAVGWKPETVADLLLGPLMSRSLVPSSSDLTEELVEETVQAACRYLGIK
ncbi:TetR/AcrR family transcriptional regulator [Rathayibacter sp. AY2B3]|uniref:TetR/AcrR family transcriptional regulator n=1 Tax=Rathayibacter sp. AY2B3 TaxID=2080569 RepID=UPI0015E371BE|nr:TetR/AcrR family transcriptional regulator [Rathayibacter sp. AY2B3]